MRTRSVAALCLASAIAMTSSACTAAQKAPTPSTAAERLIASAWKVPGDFLGEPVAEDGVVVSYFTSGQDQLEIGAWDAKTGKKLWSAAASPGSQEPGIELDAQIVSYKGHHAVTYLAPHGRSGWQSLTIADLKTGEPESIADASVWAHRTPGQCALDDTTVCVYAAQESGPAQSLRVDPSTNRLGADHSNPTPANSRMLGDHVFATDARPPAGVEELGYTDAGTIAWRRSYSEVFGSGASSDAGWAWDDDGADVIGWGSSAHYPPIGEKFTIDFVTTNTVAKLDKATGKTDWAVHGALPPEACTATGQGGDASLRPTKGVVALCVWRSGTMTATNGKPDAKYDGARRELVGIDSATGKTLWTSAVDVEQPVAADQEESAPSVVPAAGELNVTSNGTQKLVNLTTGKSTKILPSSRLVCSRQRPAFLADFHTHPGNNTKDANGRYSYNPGNEHFPCAGDLSAQKSLSLPRSVLVGVGVDAGNGYRVLSGKTGLIGYRV